MTALLVTLFGSLCFAGGLVAVLCWMVGSQSKQLDRAQERIEDLITEVAEANQSVAYWKAECHGRPMSDVVGDAVALAGQGIDAAGVRPEDLPGLIAETENLTDEQRAELNERFGAITRGEIPYVQGIEEDQ